MLYKNRILLAVLSILTILAVLVSGCGEKKSARQILQEAYKNHLTLNSYSFEGSLKFRANVEGEGFDNTPETAQVMMVLDALQKSELTFKGTSQVDPMQTELILDARIDLQGMAMNFNVPIIMNEEKMWIKIPAISMVPELSQLQGKYLELDYQELSELSQQPINPAKDIKAQQELANKLNDIFYKHVGDDYFVEVNKDEVKLPEGIEAEHVVKLNVTNDNYVTFIKLLVANVLPEALDAIAQSGLVSEEEKAELTNAKAELQKGLEEFERNMEEVKEKFKLDKAEYVTAINQENHVPYTLLDFDATVDVPEEGVTVSFGVTLDMKQSNFNQEPKWELGIPKAEEVLPFRELQSMLMMVPKINF
ncbi:MAG: hypothetical protein H0Z34_06995 [Brevibacillus sp.]|nr:hypothetical protein [Brevibacillus sp.]